MVESLVESLKEAPPRVTPKLESVCKHYWDIEPPNGPTSIGICRHCGAQDEFSNVPPELSYDRKGRLFLGGHHTGRGLKLDDSVALSDFGEDLDE